LSKGDEVVEVVGDVAQAERGQPAGQLTHGRLRICVRACRKGQARPGLTTRAARRCVRACGGSGGFCSRWRES
jgi:hypothetical protein